MDVHPDRAMIYAIIQGGVQAYQHAKSLGISSEFLVSAEDRIIFDACEEVFLPKGKMPTVAAIRQHYKIDIEEPAAEFDIDLCAKEIMRRTLQVRLTDGLGVIADEVFSDPFKARDSLSDLVKSTNWSLGSVVRTNSPSAIDGVVERYLEAKSRDGGLLGFSSPWPSRDKASLGLQGGEVTVLLAKRKSGKCISAETLITCPTTGLQITVEDFVRNGTGKVYTWDQNKPVRAVKPDAYVDTGTKECLKITWRSGRSLVTTPEHPLMTPTGWRRVDEIQSGHHTAAVATIPTPTKPDQRLLDGEIKILAYMIAEGGCSKPSTPTFTSNVPKLVEEIRECLRHLGCELKPVKSRPGNYYVIGKGRASIRENISGTTMVLRLLRSHGLMEKKSVDKVIPPRMFGLSDRQLGIFLGRLWSCDGSIEKKGVVSYSTGSQTMALQIQHLLLRFGVTSRVRTIKRTIESSEEVRDYYEVLIHRRCIERFKSHVELIGPKAKKLQEVFFQGRDRVGFIKNEEIKELVYAEMNGRTELLEDVGAKLGYSFRFQRGHVFDSRSGRVVKRVFSAFCDVYGSDLKWILDENIHWDEVESIEPVGERRVFDLTVIPTHCFIANDVIVHNTWIMLKWVEHIWNAIDSRGKPELGPGECILVVSMEMPVWQVMRRLFAIHQKLDYEKFRAGQLDEEQEKRFLDWAEEMKKPDPDRSELIVVASDRCRTVDDIVGLTAQYRPKAVFIDSFYILDSSGGRMQMWERMIENIKAIKLDIAIGFGIPVVTTTQLSGQVKKGDMNAEADAVAYAKAIGDYADAIDGIFGNTEFRGNNRRIIRGMEAREFRTVDLEIHFNPGTQEYGEIKVLDRVEDSSGDLGVADDKGDSGPESDNDDPFYDEDTITID